MASSSQSSSASDDELTSNESGDHVSSKSPIADVLSWEVLDVSDSDSRPVSDVSFTSPSRSKQQQDSEDWILEPDNDRDSHEAAICMPVIESITSLSTATKENSSAPVRDAQAVPGCRGQLRHNDSAMSGEDSDRLIIDMSISATDLDLSEILEADTGSMPASERNQSNGSAANFAILHQDGGTGAKKGDAVASSKKTGGNELYIKDVTGSQISSLQPDKTSANPTSKDTVKESIDEGCNLVISAVQGSALEEDTPMERSHNASVAKDSNHVDTQGTAGTATIDETSSVATVTATIRRSSRSRSCSPSVKHLIVIDPDGTNDKSDKFELINFRPGIIKLEPMEITSNQTLTTSTNTGSISMVSQLSTISTSASLSATTSLSSASQYVKMTPTNQVVKLVQGQPQQLGPRTIVRASPKKPMPQVIVRHSGGPRARPSYIRLGSQTLQHFARMTSPPTPHGLQTSQQRMISVLMDRSHGTAMTTTALPANFSHLLQAGPPGTLVNAGNPNNPVKVLIIPSQANSTGQVTQPGLQLANSATPPVYSVTTTGSVGTSTISKNIQPAPELKSASQMLDTKLTSVNQPAQVSGSAKKIRGPGGAGSKSQSQTGGSKSQTQSARSKASKPTPQDENVTDQTADILQSMAATEDRLKRRMLSKTNLIKEYHPSLTSGLAMVSFEFYSCHGCRDVFVNKSSLDYHKSRQSMTITYMCEPCKLGYTFTNKCQFRCHMLKHVQELKNIHKSLLERINIKPIQFGLSKSGKSDDSPRVERVDVPSPVPFEPSASKEPNPPMASKVVGKEKVSHKEIEKALETEQLDSCSSLGITISSVVSLDDPHDIQQSSVTPNQIKPTVSEPVVSGPPPPLTFVKNIPSVLTTLPVASAAPDSSKLVSIAKEHRPFGPLAVNVNNKTKSGSISPPPSANTPPSQKSQQSLSLTTPQPALPPQGQPGDGGNIFCTECSSTFSSYMKLQRHFNDADKPHPLRPPCCNTRLATECCVRAHMRTHQTQRPFVCGDCGECFRGELAIYTKHTFNCKRVMNSAVMVFPCPRCQQWYAKIDDLRLHIRDEHSESYLKCNLCPMAFKSVPSFKEHNSNRHLGVKTGSNNFTSIYKCPLCDSVFHDQQMKLDHLEQHMNSIYANQRVSFVCQICNKLCYNYAMMRYHLKDKHMVSALGNMCDICGVDCGPTIKHLVAHQRKVHHTFPANMLVDPFTQRQISNGTPKVAVKKNEGQATKAEGDGESADSNGSLLSQDGDQGCLQKTEDGAGDKLYHRDLARTSGLYNQAEAQIGEDGDGDTDKGDSQVTCHICRQTFSNRKDLVRHKKIDHGLMKRKRVSTNSRSSPTDDHKKMKQDDEDLLDETTAQFQVKSNYMLRFECDNCDYRTPTFQDLQMHQVEEHGIKARFPCLLCGITYQNMESLDKHMKSTHEGQIREYAFLCWICLERGHRKGYTKRAHLVRHFMSFHKIASKLINNDRLDEMEKKAEMSAAENLEEQETGDGPVTKRLKVDGEDGGFSCVKCDFECTSREEFQDHISKHKKGGTESFQCPECGVCFTVLPPLKNHLRLVHKIKNFTQYLETTGVKLKVSESPKSKSLRKSSISRSSSDANSNQLECTVCYRVYQDQTALKNHMRSHGMAFIRSKRLAPLAFLND